MPQKVIFFNLNTKKYVMKTLKYQTYKLKYKDFPLEYDLIKRKRTGNWAFAKQGTKLIRRK